MALNTALSGINAAQSDLNVIANNIANANTTGFKGSRAEFADVFAVTGLNLNSTAVGSGVRLQDVAQQFNQGDIQTTNNSLDLAISGNGFFVVNNGSGVQYTRAGDFQKDPSGYVTTPDGSRLQMYAANGAGGFDTSTLKDFNWVTAQSNATATSTITMTSNLPASATVPTNAFSTTDSTSYNAASPVTVYDSQGGSHQATIYYVKSGTNTWNANLYVDGQNAGTQPMTFDSTGKLATPTNGTLAFNTVNLGNGSSPMTLSLNVNNTTQYGTDYSAGTIQQNGFEAGTLSSIDINSKGVITAYYSNNQSTQIGQVAIANFANVQGLRQMGNTTWAASTDSGPAVMGTASVGQFGAIQSGALESSNTADTTAQLVDMIQAQRDYQANAQVLSTDNTLASALFNAVSR
ncbi:MULTISPECIES: flagellar hook protein FlgE [unclassified Dyella]|uniref:flagellar hook protein FlgE n=1 Tax=unclassified Dyella TaxID=2634549 RepID=UPI000C85D7A0|nr:MULTISPECIES: flagellar hook protein FlgE [unclassified Dyella]MDR3445596.1 flagellar hook protein FlgE [Dyella sp.]PMQ06996.1 Flagellar hook protein FlgE [Dyella sp. AD56]